MAPGVQEAIQGGRIIFHAPLDIFDEPDRNSCRERRAPVGYAATYRQRAERFRNGDQDRQGAREKVDAVVAGAKGINYSFPPGMKRVQPGSSMMLHQAICADGMASGNPERTYYENGDEPIEESYLLWAGTTAASNVTLPADQSNRYLSAPPAQHAAQEVHKNGEGWYAPGGAQVGRGRDGKFTANSYGRECVWSSYNSLPPLAGRQDQQCRRWNWSEKEELKRSPRSRCRRGEPDQRRSLETENGRLNDAQSTDCQRGRFPAKDREQHTRGHRDACLNPYAGIRSQKYDECLPESLTGTPRSANKSLLGEEKRPARRRWCPSSRAESAASTTPKGISPVSTARRRPTPEANETWRPSPETLNEALVKKPSDMLLFSKKARPVEYKPCTLKEYREMKPRCYIKLGKLQPDLNTAELIAKRANIERVKEFSANLRKINYDAAARRGSSSLPPVSLHHPVPRLPEQGAGRGALDFAKNIPPPHRKHPSQAPVDNRAMSRTETSASAKSRDGLRPTRLREPKTVRAVQDMRRKIEAARLPRGPQHGAGWECSSSQ